MNEYSATTLQICLLTVVFLTARNEFSGRNLGAFIISDLSPACRFMSASQGTLGWGTEEQHISRAAHFTGMLSYKRHIAMTAKINENVYGRRNSNMSPV